jgi:hypothetical protein
VQVALAPWLERLRGERAKHPECALPFFWRQSQAWLMRGHRAWWRREPFSGWQPPRLVGRFSYGKGDECQ